MSLHAKAAGKFIADSERTAWHDRALYFVREKRREWEEFCTSVTDWEREHYYGGV